MSSIPETTTVTTHALWYQIASLYAAGSTTQPSGRTRGRSTPGYALTLRCSRHSRLFADILAARRPGTAGDFARSRSLKTRSSERAATRRRDNFSTDNVQVRVYEGVGGGLRKPGCHDWIWVTIECGAAICIAYGSYVRDVVCDSVQVCVSDHQLNPTTHTSIRSKLLQTTDHCCIRCDARPSRQRARWVSRRRTNACKCSRR